LLLRIHLIAAAIAIAFLPAPAFADELTTKVYSPVLDPGLNEVEARYGRLIGDQADGGHGLLIEFARHFSKRFYGGVELETEREPNGKRQVEAFALEGLVSLGKVAGIDTGVLVEYSANRHGANAIETKLLLERRAGEFDARLNLIAEKELERGEPLEFAYAASADTEIAEELRLGAMALGDLGTSKHFTTRGEHFFGPNAKYEVEHMPGKGELEFEVGYLFALGEARHETNGLLRFQVEYGFRF
jgi:hypothetical protein